MNAKTFSELLLSLRACLEAKEWALGKDLKTVWETCERGDWLLWLCGRMAGKEGWPSQQDVVLAACDCAETALQYVRVGEDRPRKCIETVRAWVRGEANIDDVLEARSSAAVYAASSVYAAAYAACAAYAAVYAADAAVYAACAAYAAVYAADAAVYAADAASVY